MTLRELQSKYPDKTFGQIQVTRDREFVESGRQDIRNYDEWEVRDLGWKLSLPHQCDDWEIGTVDEAMDLVNQLNFAIDYCNLNK
jgi:hypothetical protein